MKVKRSYTFVILIGTFLLGACDKEAEDFTAEENTTYESEENLESAFGLAESITNAGMKYIETINASNGRTATGSELSCAAINFIGTNESGKLVINYGTDGCTGPGGKMRKGKVIIEFTGNRFENGSVVYTAFEEFYIDSLKIEGTRKSENISTSIQNPTFDIEVTQGKIVWPDESFALWNAQRTHTWSYDSESESIELSIEGTSTGTTKSGITYTTEINAPLIFNSSCLANSNYIPTSGSKTIMVEGSLNLYVKYGNGECDREITIQAGDRTTTINI